MLPQSRFTSSGHVPSSIGTGRKTSDRVPSSIGTGRGTRCRFAAQERQLHFSVHSAPAALVRGSPERKTVKTKFWGRTGPRRAPHTNVDLDALVLWVDGDVELGDSALPEAVQQPAELQQWFDSEGLNPRRVCPSLTAAGDEKYLYDLAFVDRKAGWEKDPVERVRAGSTKSSCPWRIGTCAGRTFEEHIGFLRGEPDEVSKVHEWLLSKCGVSSCECHFTSPNGKTGLIQHYGPARVRKRKCTVPEQKPCVDVLGEPTAFFMSELRKLSQDPDFEVFAASAVDVNGELAMAPSLDRSRSSVAFASTVERSGSAKTRPITSSARSTPSALT